MHNNLIKDLIQTKEYLVFVADYQKDHVKCPICGKQTDKIHYRKTQIIKNTFFETKK